VTIAELLSLLAVGVSLFAILNQRRYVSSQARLNESSADTSSVQTALELRSEMKADRDTLRGEYKVLEKEFDDLQISLEIARKRTIELTQEVEGMKRRVSQLDLMFNSLLKGAWQLVAQVKRNGQEPDYLPPREYITGPLKEDKP